MEQDPTYIQPGQICRLILAPLKQLRFESYSDVPQLGRVKLVDQKGKIIGAGLIEHVEHKT